MAVDGAAGFAAAYATLAELAALGLNRVGVISARRRPGAVHGDTDVMPWPHVASLEIHRVVAAVATVAAVVVALVIAVLHHNGPDLAVLAVPVLVGVVVLWRQVTSLRA